jgi:hypothetical protein
VRLIPFVFNTTQSMVLEFGHGYIRFHTNGGTLLEAAGAIVVIVGNNVQQNAHGYAWATGCSSAAGSTASPPCRAPTTTPWSTRFPAPR